MSVPGVSSSSTDLMAQSHWMFKAEPTGTSRQLDGQHLCVFRVKKDGTKSVQYTHQVGYGRMILKMKTRTFISSFNFACHSFLWFWSNY